VEKDKTISEDEAKKAQDTMQKITDKYVKEADQVCQQKEKEVMEV
jgi:ribosome recycling factor